MKRKYDSLGFLFFFSLSLVFITPSFAGVIKIQTQTTVESMETRVKITVRLANQGTAAAHQLQVHLKLLKRTLDSKVVPQLDPKGTTSFVFEKSTLGMEPGRYPLTVFVDFHDANQYPFSALSGLTFLVGPDRRSGLAVLGKNITMEDRGRLSLEVKNMDAHKKRIVATLVLPKELSAPSPEKDFQLDARSRKDLDFEIRNFSALSGADYPVFCYFEYDKEGVHYTTVSQAMVKIIASENLFRQYRWLFVLLAGIFMAVIVLYIIRNGLSGKRP